MALERAFPSSPHVPPRIGITISRKRPEGFWTFAFVGTYAAKKFIDLLLEDATYKWVADDQIEMHSHGSWTIYTPNSKVGLNDIFEHRLTPAEKEWELPVPYPNQIRQIRGEGYNITSDTKSTQDVQERAIAPAKVVRQPKTPVSEPVKASDRKAPVSTPAKRKATEGTFLLADLAAQLGIDPKHAREIMRKAKFPKPEAGWILPDADLKQVTRILNDGKK